jgi:hypothetical protein
MMAKKPFSIERPVLVIVEGVDDQGVLGALLRHDGICDVQIMPTGGKASLAEGLRGLKLAVGFESVRSIGILRDADTDPSTAFQSVCDALERVVLPVPERPLVPAAGPPKVTVMILPSSSRPGALEDLCLAAVAGDAAFPCVQRYFDCLSEAGVEGPRNVSRARMQVFLASRPEVGKRLGEAAHYLPWHVPAFDELRQFIQAVSR